VWLIAPLHPDPSCTPLCERESSEVSENGLSQTRDGDALSLSPTLHRRVVSCALSARIPAAPTQRSVPSEGLTGRVGVCVCACVCVCEQVHVHRQPSAEFLHSLPLKPLYDVVYIDGAWALRFARPQTHACPPQTADVYTRGNVPVVCAAGSHVAKHVLEDAVGAWSRLRKHVR
jgi:hypothetical protein